VDQRSSIVLAHNLVGHAIEGERKRQATTTVFTFPFDINRDQPFSQRGPITFETVELPLSLSLSPKYQRNYSVSG